MWQTWTSPHLYPSACVMRPYNRPNGPCCGALVGTKLADTLLAVHGGSAFCLDWIPTAHHYLFEAVGLRSVGESVPHASMSWNVSFLIQLPWLDAQSKIRITTTHPTNIWPTDFFGMDTRTNPQYKVIELVGDNTDTDRRSARDLFDKVLLGPHHSPRPASHIRARTPTAPRLGGPRRNRINALSSARGSQAPVPTSSGASRPSCLRCLAAPIVAPNTTTTTTTTNTQHYGGTGQAAAAGSHGPNR